MPEPNCAIALPLSGGYHTLIDAEDYERVSQFKWSVARPGWGGFYGVRVDQGRRVYLHRYILDARPGQTVDHISGDGLDNRKANLRLCSATENARNRRPNRRNRTGFKGVTWRSENNFQARIRVHGKQYNLGRFATPEEAARAYDQAALHHFGQFARTNDALAGGGR